MKFLGSHFNTKSFVFTA